MKFLKSINFSKLIGWTLGGLAAIACWILFFFLLGVFAQVTRKAFLSGFDLL